MPDILSASLDSPNIDTPDIPTQIDFPKWDTPTVDIPPILKQTQDAFSGYPSTVPIQDFNKIVGDNLMPKKQDGLQDLMPSYNIPLKNTLEVLMLLDTSKMTDSGIRLVIIQSFQEML